MERHTREKKPTLRKRAEKLLKGKLGKSEELSDAEVKGLVQELRVHQAELKVQNEELRRAQIELEESRNKYADLYDSAPVGYFSLSENGLIVEVNLTGASLLGVERKRLIKRPFVSYVDREDHNPFYSYIQQLLKATTRQACKLKMLRGKGKTPFYARLEGAGVSNNGDGNHSRIRVAVIDITERKGMEKGIEERERQYKNLFENIPTGVYRTTPDGRILMANPALVEMLGYSSPEELASHNLEEGEFQPSYSRSQFKELLDRKDEIKGLESKWTRSDGTPIFIRENAKAIRGEDGKVLYYEGTVEDITGRRAAEEIVRGNFARLSKKKRYEEIINTVTKAVHTSINLRGVLENAADSMIKNIGDVDDVFISLFPEGEKEEVKVYRGHPTWRIEPVRRKGVNRDVTGSDKDTATSSDGNGASANSGLSIPIHFEGKSIGAIRINSLKEDAFKEDELNLFDTVTRQIEIAINNARQAEATKKAKEGLELRVRERTKELEKVNEELRREAAWHEWAEKMLRTSEDRYRALYDDNPSMYFTLDREGRVLSVNQFGAERLGFSPYELIGQLVFNIVHEDDRKEMLERLNECFKKPGELVKWEFRKVKKNREVIWVRESARHIKNADGDAVVLVVCEDITERKRAEELLRESEKRFASFMENLPAAAWIKDVEGCYVYANKIGEKIFRTNLSDLVGKTDDEIFDPDTAKQFRDNDQTVIRSGQSLETVETLIHDDGTIHHSIVSKFPILDKNWTPVLVGGIAIDISERKRAEEEIKRLNRDLKRRLDELQALLDVAPIGIAVAQDPDCKVITMNPAGADMLGISPEENASKSGPGADRLPFKVLRDGQEVPPEELPMQHAAAHNVPVHGLELDVIHGDGRVVSLYEYALPLRDEEGNVRGCLGVFVDVTERKRAEKELQESKDKLEIRVRERTAELSRAVKLLKQKFRRLRQTEKALRDSELQYRTLVDKAPEAIVVLDVDVGRFVDCNPNASDLFGLEREEFLKIDPVDLSPPTQPDGRPSSESVWEKIQKALDGDTPTFEWTHRNASGDDIPCEVRLVRLPSSERKLVRGSVVDIKERKKAEKKLGVINSITRAMNESLSLEEVYRIALDKIIEQEYVDLACIYLVDEARNEAVMQDQRNFPQDYIQRAGRIPYPKGATWKVINTGEILNVKDVQGDPDVGSAGRELGFRSMLGIPIIALEGKTIGVLWLLSYKEQTFTKEVEEFLTSIGRQIAIAVVRAGLYRELTKKNKYETIVRTVVESVHQSINLQDVLENAVETLKQNVDGVDSTSIYLVEGKEADPTSPLHAVMKAGRGYTDHYVERAGRIPHPKGATWKTIIEGKPTYSGDVDRDAVLGPAGREMGIKSYASMPILYEGKTIGTLNVNSFRKDAFSEEEIGLMGTVIRQIEVALKNAKQAEELRNAKEGLELRVLERTKDLVETNEELTREIADRKRAEEISHRFKFISDNSNDAHFLVNREAEFVYVNKVACERLGYSEGELLNMGVYDIDPLYEKEKIKGLFGILKKEKVAPFESLHRRKDGSTFPVEVSTTVVTFNNEPYLFAVARDITERKWAEEVLRDSEMRYRLVARATQDAVWDWDLVTNDVWWNEGVRTLFGYSIDEVGPDAKWWYEHIHPEDRESVASGIHAVIDGVTGGGEPFWSDEYRYLRADGSYAYVLDRGYIMHNEGGKPVRMIGAMVDLTERKRAEEEIKTSLKDKEMLLREIHHRVKNNLQIISSLINLQSRRIKDERVREEFKESQNRVRSMALIHEKLYQTTNVSGIDLGKYAKDLSSYLFHSYGSGPGIKLKVDVDRTVLSIDKAIPCGLILNELVSNSLKHAFPGKKGGEIRVGLSKSDNGKDKLRENLYTLIISDNGVGFPEGVDFRNTTSLGMQIVCGLTRQLRGIIELDRSDGTEFKITFSP